MLAIEPATVLALCRAGILASTVCDGRWLVTVPISFRWRWAASRGCKERVVVHSVDSERGSQFATVAAGMPGTQP